MTTRHVLTPRLAAKQPLARSRTKRQQAQVVNYCAACGAHFSDDIRTTGRWAWVQWVAIPGSKKDR